MGNRDSQTQRQNQTQRRLFALDGKHLQNSGFGIAPLEPAAIDLAVAYNFNNDPFDSAIVAAVNLSLPLITKDAAITDSNLVEIYW